MKIRMLLMFYTLALSHIAASMGDTADGVFSRLENEEIKGSNNKNAYSRTYPIEFKNNMEGIGSIGGYSNYIESPKSEIAALLSPSLIYNGKIPYLFEKAENHQINKKSIDKKMERKLFLSPFALSMMYNPYMWGIGYPYMWNYPYMAGMRHTVMGHHHSAMAALHYGTAQNMYMYPYPMFNPMLSMWGWNPFIMHNSLMMGMHGGYGYRPLYVPRRGRLLAKTKKIVSERKLSKYGSNKILSVTKQNNAKLNEYSNWSQGLNDKVSKA